MIAAMIKNDGIKTPQIVMPRVAFLIDRHIMSPKHLLPGGRILVESHVRMVIINAIKMQTGVVNFGFGANRVFFNERIVISRPKTKWK
jgi:hypothetical protein